MSKSWRKMSEDAVIGTDKTSTLLKTVVGHFVSPRPPRIAERSTVSVFNNRFQQVGQCSRVFEEFMTRRAHEVQTGRHSSPHDRIMYATIDAFSDE